MVHNGRVRTCDLRLKEGFKQKLIYTDSEINGTRDRVRRASRRPVVFIALFHRNKIFPFGKNLYSNP